jgi:hypothetical protein
VVEDTYARDAVGDAGAPLDCLHLSTVRITTMGRTRFSALAGFLRFIGRFAPGRCRCTKVILEPPVHGVRASTME